MPAKTLVSRLPFDPYIAAIVGMVCLASILPAHATGAVVAGDLTTVAIALLFFLHGARLAPRAALAGARHWRLHAVVLASTFLLFPAIVLAARAVVPQLLSAPLWTGMILLSMLPSTPCHSLRLDPTFPLQIPLSEIARYPNARLMPGYITEHTHILPGMVSVGSVLRDIVQRPVGSDVEEEWGLLILGKVVSN